VWQGGAPNRLRKTYFGTEELRSSAYQGQEENTPAGCSKRSSSKAATPQLTIVHVSRLTFHGSWERCENAAGGLFQQPPNAEESNEGHVSLRHRGDGGSLS